MDFQKYILSDSLKSELGRLFFISAGVFLFILFFQPFPLDLLDYNDRLLYVTGFGGITFLLGTIVLIIIPLLIPKWFKISEWESGPPVILNVFSLILTATAYTFYTRYVGKTSLSLYIMFKIFLVCLLPFIILIILYKNKSLELLVSIVQNQNKLYLTKIKELEKNGNEEKVDILSENKSDKLTLKYKDIISVKSADNYIEIYFMEKDNVEKKLIRNTLKNIETLLTNKRDFIRCHRTRIVNVMYIDKIARSYSGCSLRMSCFDDEIPVSRQYLVQVKEAISTKE